jgi:hypothetical protein
VRLLILPVNLFWRQYGNYTITLRRAGLAQLFRVRTAGGSLQGNLLMATCCLSRSSGVAERDLTCQAKDVLFKKPSNFDNIYVVIMRV